MKQIERVSIALKPNVYSTFRNLNNTVSNTLGEYVDNAVQSYLDHRERLLQVDGPDYKLSVSIVIDWETRAIYIRDNAAGTMKGHLNQHIYHWMIQGLMSSAWV